MSTIGILITTFNRPEYLSRCLQSIKDAELLAARVLIIDDASTHPETHKLIDEFSLPDQIVSKMKKSRNSSIKASLLVGFDHLFNSGCEVVLNIDGDAIVRPDFLEKLLQLHSHFENNIITGFNCLTKNKDGTERHKVITSGDAAGQAWNAKESVGGINMLFDYVRYLKYIRPALDDTLQNGGNWDHKACLRSKADGFHIICTVPSVVQHIGIESSMGHSTGGEPPDVADDFVDTSSVPFYETGLFSTPADKEQNFDMKLWYPHDHDQYNKYGDRKLLLKNVTLVGADCINADRLVQAADYTMEGLRFADEMLFHSKNTLYSSSTGLPDRRMVEIDHFQDKADYSIFMMKKLGNYLRTSHVLVIQYDGFVLNPLAWNDEWLNWDYIGAPWEWYQDGMNVGNGGFSLRSKKLHDVLMMDKKIVPMNDRLIKHKEEDHNICRIYRRYLESNHGIKFAPLELARQFSIEGWNTPNPKWTNQFGFHGRHVDISASGKSF